MDTTALPIIHDLHDEKIIADPYPTYSRMRADMPLWLNPASNSFTVTRYRDVVKVLRSSEFSNTRVDELFNRLPEISFPPDAPLKTLMYSRLLFTEGEQHARVKALVAQAFSHRQLLNYESLVQSRLNLLLQQAPEGLPADIIDAVIRSFPGMVILSILGLPADEQENMRTWTDDIYAWMGHYPADIRQRTTSAVASVDALSTNLKRHIAMVRERPRDDMLSALVAARDEGRFLDENELVANVIGLVNAGQETTACLLANGLYRLLQYPRQLERLRREPELLDSAIQEMLRFDAPAQFIARRVVSPIQLHKLQLEPGEMVAIGLGSANRDNEVFPEPDRFDIARNPNKHLSFGLGHHFCTGRGLALLEARVFFRTLLSRFSHIVPCWDDPSQVTWRPTLSFRSPTSLPVILQNLKHNESPGSA